MRRLDYCSFSCYNQLLLMKMRARHGNGIGHRRRRVRHDGGADRGGERAARRPARASAARRAQAPCNRQRALQPHEHRRLRGKLPRGERRFRAPRALALHAGGHARLFPCARSCHGHGARRAGLSPLQLRKQRRGRAALRTGARGGGAALRRLRPLSLARPVRRGLHRRHGRGGYCRRLPHRRLRRRGWREARRRNGRVRAFEAPRAQAHAPVPRARPAHRRAGIPPCAQGRARGRGADASRGG